MWTLAFSRRSRRRADYQAVIRDLAGIQPAPHLKPLLPPSQPFQSKSERHRAESEKFRRTGGE